MSIQYAYNRFCTRQFPLPSIAQVEEFEEAIGVVLPDDYRQYLLDFNGGFFSEPLIMCDEPGYPQDRLTLICGLGLAEDQSAFDLFTYIDLFDDNFPAQIVSIGDTLMGSLLFIVTDRDGEDYGNIGLKLAGKDDSFFLSSGIEDFFSSLKAPVPE